jgi:acetyltransferase-like isoleucine patch superfamily enzyme
MKLGFPRRLLARYTLATGRLTGLYRKLCAPAGAEWAAYLKRHGGLYAMGEHCVIQANVTITDPAHVRLGNNVHLTGCTLFGHDGTVAMLKQMSGRRLDRVGRIDIGDNVFVGHQAIIMPGISIGSNVVVGAGAIVTRDVAPNTIVAGNPARPIGTVDAMLDRYERETRALGWATHPQLAPDYFGPAEPQLTALRNAAFFPTPAAAGELQ